MVYRGKPGYFSPRQVDLMARRNPKDLLRGEYPSLDLGLIRKWANATATTSKGNSFPGLLRWTARPARERIANWIAEYQAKERWAGAGFYAFRSDWIVGRTWIDLQLRLAVEQALWQTGQPYSQLVTGFRPYGLAGTRPIYEGL